MLMFIGCCGCVCFVDVVYVVCRDVFDVVFICFCVTCGRLCFVRFCSVNRMDIS